MAAIAGIRVYKRSTDPVEAQQAYASARTLFETARYNQAIVSCDRAISLKPEFAEAYVLRGKSRVAQYDTDQAIADFTRAIELSPRDAPARIERASANLDLKNYAAAIDDATAAIGIDAQLSRAYNLRATALRGTGDAQKAISDFTRAVEIEPNSDNFFQRGATYQMVRDHRHAVEDFTQAISFDPDKPQAYFARAESERELGQTQQADKDHLKGRLLDGR